MYKSISSMTKSKRQKVAPVIKLNRGIGDEATVRELKTSYKEKIIIGDSKSYSLVTSPFNVCTFHDVLDDDVALNLLNEIQELEFTFKENDLLSLHQTTDLNDAKSMFISAVKVFIYSDLKKVIETVTDVKFNNHVDLHGIKFNQYDNLLCHSDCLSSRHTAFILYLVPKTWSLSSGGTLDLFASDESNEPTKIVRSVCPKFNTFSWFEVSNKSWHQVSEVIEDDTRWSISGWYHSDHHPVYEHPTGQISLSLNPPTESEMDVLKSWISLKYLNLEISSEVQQQFQEDSEVSLAEFLNEEKYTALLSELSSTNWELTGPRNKKYYEVAKEEPGVISEFLDLLKTDSFSVLLSHLTGLPLSLNYEDPDCSEFLDTPFGMKTCSVSCWNKGHYSLLSDQEIRGLPEILHLYYHADLQDDYELDMGGYVSFISHGDKEPLLVIPPQNNTLSLVFTRPDEFSFTKYLNSKFKKPYYCVSAQFVARTPNEENKEEELKAENCEEFE